MAAEFSCSSFFPVRSIGGLPGGGCLSGFGRESYANALQSANAWLRAGQGLHQARQDAFSRALAVHQAAARQLRCVDTQADLLAIHSELMSFYLESHVQRWQQLASVGLQMQAEMMAQTNSLLTGQSHGQNRPPAVPGKMRVAVPANEASMSDSPDEGRAAAPRSCPVAQLARR